MCYKLTTCLPRHVTNSRCRADVGSEVGQRRRRWLTVVPTLGQRLAFIHFTTGQASFSLVSLHPIIAHSVNTIEHNARELCLPLTGYFCPLTSPGWPLWLPFTDTGHQRSLVSIHPVSNLDQRLPVSQIITFWTPTPEIGVEIFLSCTSWK